MSIENVLVSSVGRRGELVTILREALQESGGRGGVFAVDRSPLTAAGHLADGLDLVPGVTSPGFVDCILEVCARRKIRHLIPTIDPELAVYADSRERFAAAGVTTWVSSPAAVAIAGDKRETNLWLRSNSIPTVEQLTLTEALEETIEYPVIAKPARGSSSSGLIRAQCRSDLERLAREQDYVVEQVAPGDEFTLDLLVDSFGRCVCVVPRKRLETRGGEVSKGITVHDAEMIALGRQVAETLPGAFGVLNVQVFRCPDTRSLNVIEINARFGGGFPLSWAAGARMPAWLMAHLRGDESPDASLDWADDLLMLRYDTSVFLRR